MRLLCLFLTLTFSLPPVSANDKVDLEVTRVAIFNSGVAYYECVGEVDGDATAELNFRTEQVNDILKSLIVQDLNGGRVGVVRYASQDPIEKTLKSFGVDITGKPSLANLLDQLRGQPIEINGPVKLDGVIIGVETHKSKVNDQVIEETFLNVLTERGIGQAPIRELGGVRLKDPKVAEELNKALATLARSNDASKKSVQLRFEGTGKRTVRVAYLLEAPIWKTSYRLALDDNDKPFLQGWATVENATEEDWDNVRLSLVSGRPISFQMDLYTPIYIPRPFEELELYASLRAPDFAAGRAVRKGAAPPPPAMAELGTRLSRGRAGGQNAFGGGQRYDTEMMNEDSAGVMLGLRGTSVQSVASAEDAGELFEYSIDAPVALPRQQSAMLPILNQEVDGRKVSIYNQRAHAKHPLNGLELTNNSGLHLMQGPVTLFDGSVYAGDAKLPDMQPEEKRLLAYALDLSTEVSHDRKSTPNRITAVKVVNGVMIRTNKYVNESSYEIRNKSDKDRNVLIEHPWSRDWKLVAPNEAYETTDNLLRFDVPVAAGASETLTVKLERIADQQIQISNLDKDDINFYVRSRAVSADLKKALMQLIERKELLNTASKAREYAARANEAAKKEQGRIRDNLRTLQQNSDAYRRQIEKFDRLETEIETTQKQLEDAVKAERQAQRAVDDFVRQMNVG